MRFTQRPLGFLTAILLALLPLSSAEQYLSSSSLSSCQSNSSFSATLFDVVFTPSNGSLEFDIVGTSTISGNVSILIIANVYGLQAYKQTLDPCSEGLLGMCPMSSGPIVINSNLQLPSSAVKQIPGS